MNKNLLIAILVFAFGGLYYYNKNHVYSGTFSENGIYTDSKHGFALSFPRGWKKGSAKDLTPENGYSFEISHFNNPSIIILSPMPNRAIVSLDEVARSDQSLESISAAFFNRMNMSSKYVLTQGSGNILPHAKGFNVQPNGSLAHISLFQSGKRFFMLFSVAEKGFSPKVPIILNGIVDSVHSI